MSDSIPEQVRKEPSQTDLDLGLSGVVAGGGPDLNPDSGESGRARHQVGRKRNGRLGRLSALLFLSGPV